MADVYLAVVALFEHSHRGFSDSERALACDVLTRLAKDVEMSIRIGVASRLADTADAPHDLIVLLANDAIEIARPVLLRSPLLGEADLLAIIAGHGADHQTAIAERARQWEDLQEPLARRPDLPPVLAREMLAWVSEGLKQALAGRYAEIDSPLKQALDQTASALIEGCAALPPGSAEKLIRKLAASGTLRPSFLIRVLNQGQMELFEYGFAELLGMELEAMREALYGESPLPVALACRAAGIDRSVFLTVFNLSRHHREVTTKASDADWLEIDAIFSRLPKAEALGRLKASAA